MGFEPTHTNIAGLKSAPLDQLGQTAVSGFRFSFLNYSVSLNYSNEVFCCIDTNSAPNRDRTYDLAINSRTL